MNFLNFLKGNVKERCYGLVKIATIKYCIKIW